MIKKVALRIAVFFLATYNFAISQTDFEKAKVELVKLRDEFAKDNSPGDILFLVDTTSSLSNYAFQAEKIFIEGFLNTITVSVKAVRVELIPFDSPQVSSYIDQVSNPTSAKNKCTFGEKMIQMHHTYGWATNTKGAFQQAYDVCLRKQKRSVKTVVILLMDGYWNYPQGDPSPVLIAQKLHTQAVEVYAIGIWRPDKFKLSALVKNPAKQAFLLENFNQLRELAFYLRGGKWTGIISAQKIHTMCV